jgi:hypothetical protein
MAIKHLGKAKPNDPFFTRGYTINLMSNVPQEKPAAAPEPPTKPKRKKVAVHSAPEEAPFAGSQPHRNTHTCYQHLRTNIREARLHEPKIDQAVGLAADDYPEKNLWG